MRAGLLHPTTGYSLLITVKAIEFLLAIHSLKEWPESFAKFCLKNRQDQKFYVLLNRVMFQAVRPTFRYRFLEHFYTLPEQVISRFYGHQMDFIDKVRFFMRRPPVRIGLAFDAVLKEKLYAT
jgi:lycopene beta-cyclase